MGNGYQHFSTYPWPDTATLLNIYLNCVRPHFEYACTLWDPYTYKNISMLEPVKKFACKVCLKRWDLDCDSMLHLLGVTRLSTRQQYLKLYSCTKQSMAKLISLPEFFVPRSSPYLSGGNFLIRPLAHTNYVDCLFVNVIVHWNNLIAQLC